MGDDAIRATVSAFGVAFAAFCIWLTVRIINRREKWAIGTVVGLVAAISVLFATGFFETLHWLLSYHG